MPRIMLSLKSLLVLLALLGIGLFFWHNWRAREHAERLARDTCRRLGVQFLDESVAPKAWRLVRDDGQWKLRRTFAFEFSRTGSDRWPGELTLLGGQLAGVEFNLVDPAGAPAPVIRPISPPTNHDKVVPLRRDQS